MWKGNGIKKIVLEGFAFVGGAIIYSVGTLGFAHVEVQADYMQVPQYLGIIVMIVGAALGIYGLIKDK